MLRFSYHKSDGREDWRLSGRLDGLWVDELRSVWRRTREQTPGARPTVDLKEVTFIDEAGEQLLAEMKSAGADLVVGFEREYLLAGLKNAGVASVRPGIEHPEGGRR